MDTAFDTTRESEFFLKYLSCLAATMFILMITRSCMHVNGAKPAHDFFHSAEKKKRSFFHARREDETTGVKSLDF